MIVILFLLTLAFGASASVAGLATFYSIRARDIDAGIVGVIVTGGLAIAAVCAGSILVTL